MWRAASRGMRRFRIALDLWSETTANIARPVVNAQLKTGEVLLSTLVHARQESASLQNAVGERIANVTEYSHLDTFGLLEVAPSTATAAVADFLTLEQK